MTTAPVDELARALDATDRVIAGIGDDQWHSATPCSDWDACDLARHLVLGNRIFAAMLSGEPPPASDAQPETAQLEGDVRAAFRTSAEQLLTAFRRPGALDQTVTLPIGPVPGAAALHIRITEVLVHGWDLARATGQRGYFPEDLAERALEFTREKLKELPAERRPFAPPQPVPEDARAIERLAAYLGRSVTS